MSIWRWQGKDLAERLAGAEKEHRENFAKLGALLAEQRKVNFNAKMELLYKTVLNYQLNILQVFFILI